MAEIVREAVRAYIAPPRHAGPPGAGVFASGHADTAERVDDVLAATGFGDSSAAVSPVQSRTGRRRSTTRARTVLQRERQGLVLPAPTIPEIDHLLGTRLGPNARLAFYAGIVEGHYLVADLPSGSNPRVVELHKQFRPLAVGFVDAAVVALAEAMGIPRVATSDRRHFEPMAAALGLRLMPEA